MDPVEAAMKMHRMKEEVAMAKLDRKRKAKAGDIQYKSDESDEDEYDRAAKARLEYEEEVNAAMKEDGEDSEGHNSYDSELEADFFGKADKGRNEEDDKYYEMLNARK